MSQSQIETVKMRTVDRMWLVNVIFMLTISVVQCGDQQEELTGENVCSQKVSLREYLGSGGTISTEGHFRFWSRSL